MRVLVISSVLIAVLLGARVASAGEKRVLGVCFLLTEATYAVEFTQDKQDQLEREAAALFGRKLAERTAFLDAQAAVSETCEANPGQWLLRVELNRTAGAQGSTPEVGFHISLQGSNADDAKVYWVFRETGRTFQVDYKVPAFIRQLSKALDRADFDELVAELLSQVPVSHQAAMYRDAIFGAVGWELTEHTHEDLCIAEDSELVMESQFGTGAAGSTRKVYTIVTKRGGGEWRSLNIRSEVSEARNPARIRTALEDMTDTDVQVLAVYVEKYMLLRQCRSSPDEAGL